MSINNCTLVGRLTKDPEMRSVGDNIPVCQFTLAVDKRKKDSGTNFIDCVAWKGVAETISQYVKKGQLLGVVGSLDQQNWEKDGEKKSKIQVIVSDIQFLTPKSSDGEGPSKQQEIDLLADIPF